MVPETARRIETARLVLRPFNESPLAPGLSSARTRDLEAFVALRANPEVILWMSDGGADPDVKATDEWMRSKAALPWTYIIEEKTTVSASAIDSEAPMQESQTQAALAPAADGQQPIVGSIGLRLRGQKPADFRSQETEVWYCISPRVKGQGYATEAVQALLTAFWRHLEEQEKATGKASRIQCMEAITDTENVPSQRVLERCGFQAITTWERNHFSKAQGSWRDLLQYRLERPGSARSTSSDIT